MKLKQGDTIRIESYKHGGTLHRAWKKSVILRSEDPLILANQDVEVVEKDGDEWIFPGLAICRFSRQDWFQTVILYDEEFRLKRYYCHIASPCRIDSESGTLAYIDYDLDLSVGPDLKAEWLDEDEFSENRIRYGYPDEVLKSIAEARRQLEERIHRREEPFSPEFAPYWCKRYLSLMSRKE